MTTQGRDDGGIRVRVADRGHLASCLAIRHEVFVEGQGVPDDVEWDGLDDGCVHFLALADDVPVGTARLRESGGSAKAERVAVRASARGRGVGRALMRALEAEALRRGFAEVVLHAQERVLAFYTALGYVVEGERFLEAGIPHRAMRRKL